ncbi:uncharacterized protein LOC141607860 [Silene latifolia]|uniref:uncharacterized protein LOC141607860 n=1 Tax=Silene latifolia TaxID=37657 RepID=UPI003D76BEF1
MDPYASTSNDNSSNQVTVEVNASEIFPLATNVSELVTSELIQACVANFFICRDEGNRVRSMIGRLLRSRRGELVEADPEPERSFLRRKMELERVRREEVLSTSDSSVIEKTSILETIIPVRMPNIASHSEPTADYIPKGFKLSTDEDGNTFDIRPSYINLVERNLYRGVSGEDPRKHMERFADYCSSIPTSKGVTQDKIKEVLFPFSLTDNAREWLTDLDGDAAGITDWTTLALAFYKKYFPPQRTNALRAQITNFKQTGSENLFEAWCRFKKAVRSVPHHGFQQVATAVSNYQKPPQFPNPQQESSSSGGISEVGELKSMIQALATQVSRSDQATNATIKLLESQIAQVAANQSTRQPGQLPSQSEKREETLNMITLRSGSTYFDRYCWTDVSGTNSKATAADRCLKRVKKTEPEFARFGELVRGLNVSVPFIELLKQVPTYLKFMREVLMRKRTIDDVETVALTEGCSAHLQNRTPPKLADPGSFSIPCHIGLQLIDNALCDLGASVSVLLLSLAKRLGFTKFHCTNMTVQMADRTLSRPLGVLQDILCK